MSGLETKSVYQRPKPVNAAERRECAAEAFAARARSPLQFRP
jgi:hypothetical protein